MSKVSNEAGVYQLENGYWGYRFIVKVNGKAKSQKRTKDESGNPYKTQKQAERARSKAIAQEKDKLQKSLLPQNKIEIKTVKEVFEEYCEKGRSGKAYATIVKQDSLWKNHLCEEFGSRSIDSISVAEINDYLERLYYVEDRAYSYVESFLKMFYLIFGQAYSRNYMDVDSYNKMCVNQNTKIHMPKLKVDEDTDIQYFDSEQAQNPVSIRNLSFMLGKYCGLRINECYGLKWENVDLKKGTISIEQQMQYQNGLIKLVPLKTRNARRTIYLCEKMKDYLSRIYEMRKQYEEEFQLQREQNQTFIKDIDGTLISSLGLVNSLPNGKIQTNNSMKYHSRTLQGEYNINFKYHYLRHTYGTRLAELNTPTHLLCNPMGHASSAVTQKYYLAVSKDGVQELIKNLNRM